VKTADRPASSVQNLPGAFSLLEMLIAIAVLAILAALLVPTLRSVQERARSTECLSNVRQLHVAVMTLSNEENGQLPLAVDAANNSASWGWYLLEGDYLPPLPPVSSGKRARKHPLFDPGSKVTTTAYTAGSYGINRNLAGPLATSPVRTRIAAVPNPGQKFLIFCSGAYAITRLQAAASGSPHLYLPGRSANQSTEWPESSRRDAIEGRHGRKIHTISLAGGAETWNANELPVTPDRWEK